MNDGKRFFQAKKLIDEVAYTVDGFCDVNTFAWKYLINFGLRFFLAILWPKQTLSWKATFDRN